MSNTTKDSRRPASNEVTLGQKLKSYTRTPGSLIVMLLVMLAAIITFAVLIFLIAYILIHGVPYIQPSLFSLEYSSENASLMPALANTVIMTALSLVIAVPFGIFSAIFLVEYAKRGNKFVEVIRLTTETLQGIPSIVYGLFGMLFFVTTCGWGFSILAGAFTLSIMVLPLIMRSTEEALKAVTDSYREGSFGLGAGKLRTVFQIRSRQFDQFCHTGFIRYKPAYTALWISFIRNHDFSPRDRSAGALFHQPHLQAACLNRQRRFVCKLIFRHKKTSFLNYSITVQAVLNGYIISIIYE